MKHYRRMLQCSAKTTNRNWPIYANGRQIGVAFPDGRFEATPLALSAMTDSLNRAIYSTPDQRRSLNGIFRRWRTDKQFRHVLLHPPLP